MTAKNLRIETVRGLACMLLVFYHVVGDAPTSGLKIAEGEWLRQVNDFLSYVRMPLFTFLSGFVYAWRPCTTDVASFIRGKARRLLIPLMVVGTLFAIIQAATPGSNRPLSGADWLYLHIIPVAHYWYLEALFLIFVAVPALEIYGLLRTPLRLLCCFGVATIGCLLSVKVSPWFGVAGALYLFPFFIAGVGACRFGLRVLERPASALGALLLLTALLAYAAHGQLTIGAVQTRSLLAVAIGVLSAGLLIVWMPKINGLALIGSYSYSIYLFHVFGTAGARVMGNKLGIESVALLASLSMLCGIGLPVAIDYVVRRHWLAKLLFIGAASRAGHKSAAGLA